VVGRRLVEHGAVGRRVFAATAVNNAAIDFTSDLLETDVEEVKRVFETNFFGAFVMFTRVARELKARGGGSIVNVSSRLASIGVPAMVVYSASKGTLLAFTRGAAIELAKDNIRVNAVAPGLTATPLYDAWLGEQDDPRRLQRRSPGRFPRVAWAHPRRWQPPSPTWRPRSRAM
jgi:NAD(P)-dependent dehydrogenase (short-subunit alcohol dehydrogenase family)